MSDYLKKLKNKQQDILLGEVAALLHDIGKCHPDFIKNHSIESKELKNKSNSLKHHAKKVDDIIKEIFKDDVNSNKKSENLLNLLKQLKFKIGDETSNIHTIIKKHHPENGESNKLLKLIIYCDRLDSADDKGIVRQKQLLNNTVITNPFGYPKEKINLDCLNVSLKKLAEKLSEIFEIYTNYNISITCLREVVLKSVNTFFVHVLGETRMPANDVSLWDHSYSTATLYKTELSRVVLQEEYGLDNFKRRIFGICWNGKHFINRGEKVADILARKDIVEEIKSKLREKFEVCYPIGNIIYEDINGVFLTFPEVKDKDDNKTKKLAQECAEKALKVIDEKSKGEIWPFFTLSTAKRNLTVIANELKYAENKNKIAKISSVIFMDNGDKKRKQIPMKYRSSFLFNEKSGKELNDICPVCKLRSKNKNNNTCKECKNRKKGRLNNWLKDRETTIWIDEIVDKNNCYALLKLNFDLNKWLDGTMIGTIYSQTYEDWFYSKAKEIYSNKQDMNELRKITNKKTIELQLKEIAMLFLEYFYKTYKCDKDYAKDQNEITRRAKVFSTFFEDVNFNSDKKDSGYIGKGWENFKSKLDEVTTETVHSTLFTQNPSPARLSRIWREGEEFWQLSILQIFEKIYPEPGSIWKRISFEHDSELQLKNNRNINDYSHKPLVIKINGLMPEELHVLYNASDNTFYTIEALNKFSYKGLSGIVAVKKALKKEQFYNLATEKQVDKNLLLNKIKVKNIILENYTPLIKLESSASSMRLLVPACDSIKILQLITELYNERFKKVIGKLPLNAGLLVTKRKFPLYVLLGAGERMLMGNEFREAEYMEPWWELETVSNDNFFKYYPVKRARNAKNNYTLNELAPVSRGKLFELYPGYFDFDFLLGTDDRYNINYGKGSYKKNRAGNDYGLFSARPFYFYQISEVIALWEILKNNISRNQLNILEQMLLLKKKEWVNVKEDEKKKVYRDFAIANMEEAFEERWPKLSGKTKNFLKRSVDSNLLLDTLTLFNHIIKYEEVN